MLGKLKSWFSALSTAGKIGVVVAVGVVGIVAAGPQPQCDASVVYRTESQTVAYRNTNVNDSSLPTGQTNITTVGVNGQKELRHKVTIYAPSGCKASTDVIVNQTIIKQPVNQVTAVGTFIAPAPTPAPAQSITPTDCPNGTYVNSVGNTVCSPYSSPTAPAGATAQCVDGTYSFSQSRSGTCSHHGGVAQWL
jgi:Protein of unknown function (DUF3761)/G5 domain